MRDEFRKLQIPLPIAVIGLGRTGESIVRLLAAMGVSRSEIITFDEKSPADFSDAHLMLKTRNPKSLCVSPGIPLRQDWIQDSLKNGVRLTSELEIAFSLVTSENVIAITGAVGKSTTTSIVGAGARSIDQGAFIGGNLGTPLAEYAIELIEGKRSVAQYLVLELSSYQLENFQNLRSDVSILTHLSPNHLDRYDDLDDYYQTKLKIFKATTGSGILNRNGGHIVSLIDLIQKSNPQLSFLWTDKADPEFKKRLIQKPLLVGSYNLDNLALAFRAAMHFSWPASAYVSMLEFPGLPHRLENCGTHDGILFLNDSKATTIESVLQALKAVRQEYPQNCVHVLLGGKDKNLPWEKLSLIGKDPHFRFYFFGEVGAKAQSNSQLAGACFATLNQCLGNVKSQLNSEDIVLLSPGGTSFDEFKNFEDRGQFFKNWILAEFQNH